MNLEASLSALHATEKEPSFQQRLGLSFLRELRAEAMKNGITQIKAVLPQNVAAYILNTKRAELHELETKSITITISSEHGSGQMAMNISSC